MEPKLFKGGRHTDGRGSITFFNEFDMSEIKRFYHISPKGSSVVRAWQGHKIESKWFHVLSGKFIVRLIRPDDWKTPSPTLPYSEFILSANSPEMLFIPGGFLNGFIALEEDSKLLVYSNVGLGDSIKDDFRFESNYWSDWNKI